jgi:hypothetical protein
VWFTTLLGTAPSLVVSASSGCEGTAAAAALAEDDDEDRGMSKGCSLLLPMSLRSLSGAVVRCRFVQMTVSRCELVRLAPGAFPCSICSRRRWIVILFADASLRIDVSSQIDAEPAPAASCRRRRRAPRCPKIETATAAVMKPLAAASVSVGGRFPNFKFFTRQTATHNYFYRKHRKTRGIHHLLPCITARIRARQCS